MKKRPSLKMFASLFGRRKRYDPITGEESEKKIDLSESITDVGYYQEVSFRYHSAQMIAIMLLAVYFAVSVLTNAELLSADSLIYFAKDLSSSIAMQESEARESMIYSSDEDNDYGLYREGLVVLGSQKLTVFTASGRESHSHLLTYRTPRVVSSGRYLIACDMGGKDVSVYNSFTCVKRITTENNIRFVAASNKGYYALVTDSVEYGGEVLLYNENHRMVNRYRLEQYTLMAALRQDGSELALISVAAEEGRMQTHVSLVTPNGEEWGHSTVIPDAYPIACHYTEENELLLVTTTGIYRFNEQLEPVARNSFSADNVLRFRATEEGCVLVCRDNVYDTATRIIVFDKSTDQVYNISISSEVYDASYAYGVLAVLTKNELNVYRDGQSDPYATASFNGEYTKLLAYDEDEFLVCGPAKAVVLSPNERH